MFKSLFKSILFINFILLYINSCGFKGPLYLPPKEPAKTEIKTNERCKPESANIIESELKLSGESNR